MRKYTLLTGYAKLSGITLDEICSHLQISKSTLYNKIAGRTDFTLEEARKISALLNRTIEEIFQR